MFGQSDTGPVQTQLDCYAAGKGYDPATNQCIEVAQPGVADAAAAAACQAIGGTWDPQARICMTASGPLQPPTPQPQQPAAQAGVPWTTLGAIGLGVTALYLVMRTK